MSAPFHTTVIFVLLSAGCATQSANLAAAPPDHVAVEQQPVVTTPAPAAVPESPPPAALPASDIKTVPPETATITPAAAGMPEKERVPAVVVPPKPQVAKVQPAAAKEPVAASTPQTRLPAPRPQPPAPTASPPEPQAAPPLALATLEQRLKDTSAIGVFTKLALKNQVDDLLGQFRARHEGSNKTPLAQLRQTYDQLLAKVHDLLKSGDPSLAAAIMNSRESIWLVLADPVRFAKL